MSGAAAVVLAAVRTGRGPGLHQLRLGPLEERGYNDEAGYG